MKKLYIIFLTSLLLFIPTTNAVTPYGLDQPIFELNGYTLREVFDDGNLVLNNDFSDGIVDWSLLGSPIVTLIDGVVNVLPEYDGEGIYQDNDLIIGNDYYVVVNYKGVLDVRLRVGLGGEIDYRTDYQTSSDYTNLSFVKTLTNDLVYIHLVGQSEIQFDIDYIYTINRTSLGISHLSVEQMDMFYDYYLEGVSLVNAGAISTEFFLMSIFFMYILIMCIGYFTKSKYFYFAGSLLWFVPIFNYTNIFIITTSIIVFLIHLTFIFYSDKDDVFE